MFFIMLSLSAAFRFLYAARFSNKRMEDNYLNGAVNIFDLYLKKRSIVS
jgi:hypothetical protein